MTESKKCTKCSLVKSLLDFKNNKKAPDGKRSECRACTQKMRQDWLNRNPGKEKEYRRRDYEKVRAKVDAGDVPNIESKRCNQCGEVKPRDHYGRSSSQRTGLNAICRKCKSGVDAEYRLNNAEKKKVCDKNYRLKNSARLRQINKEWRIANKEVIAAKSKARWEANKEEYNQQRREHYAQNKDEIKAYRSRMYYERYRGRYKAGQLRRNKERMATDPGFRICHYVKKRTRDALKGKIRTSKSLVYLGCSIDFLKKHIESQFWEGMNWGNHAPRGWHIDHIRPLASFDLTSEEQRYIAFNWTNLQPLWWRDNLRKGASLSWSKK